MRDVDVWVRLTVVQMRRIGVDSLPVALLIATFTGIVLAYQASYTLSGLVPPYFVGVLVGKSLMLELAPVLTGLALAGRVGANIAAELGTMKVTEQVDALETLAFDQHSFLVVPRVVASAVMFPIVIAMATVVGIIAGWIASLFLLDISTSEFMKGLRQFYQFKDVWYGVVKSISFGIMISLIGCRFGLDARGGAEGVGLAATKAVVSGASMILVLDAIWAITVL
jgi:phospholipid/cholesterol/gamma-HCH transport system permease protein